MVQCSPGSDGNAITANDAEASPAPPSYDTLPGRFGVISLNMSDKIRLIGFGEPVVELVKEIITSSWPKGIDKTRNYNESLEIQLRGMPWAASHSADGTKRALIRNILQGLYESGWAFESSLTVTKKATEKDSLVFRRVASLPPVTCWFTIALDGYTVLTVHNGPKDFCEQLVAMFTSKDWCTESAFLEDRQEIRMKKSYWLPSGEDTVKVRLMLLAIMETLDRSGCRLYASLRAAGQSGGEVDQLVCVQNETPITKGRPDLVDL